MQKKKKRKYDYYIVLQVYSKNHGWEDVDSVEANSSFEMTSENKKELASLKKEYKEAYRRSGLKKFRTVKRREEA